MGERVDVIDYYEASSKPFSHYAEVLEARGYEYECHFLPHDSRARSYQTGVTTVELAREKLGPKVTVIPIMPVEQGIMAARSLLQQEVRIHEQDCGQGLDALRAYSCAFDEERRIFSNKPEHGWASHGSDAWRYLATMARAAINLLRPEPPPKATDWTRRATFRDALIDYRRENPRKKRPYIPPEAE